VSRQRMRNETVVAGIEHRRVQEAVDEHGAGRLVHLVLHRFATLRHLNDGIDVPRRVDAGWDLGDVHASLRGAKGRYHPSSRDTQTTSSGKHDGNGPKLGVQEMFRFLWGVAALALGGCWYSSSVRSDGGAGVRTMRD